MGRGEAIMVAVLLTLYVIRAAPPTASHAVMSSGDNDVSVGSDIVDDLGFTVTSPDTDDVTTESDIDDVKTAARQRSKDMQYSTAVCPDVHGPGWGLSGRDWGCCGNYEGCCVFASSVCFVHDAMCRCCRMGRLLCGPLCRPDPDCGPKTHHDRPDHSHQAVTGNHHVTTPAVEGPHRVITGKTDSTHSVQPKSDGQDLQSSSHDVIHDKSEDGKKTAVNNGMKSHSGLASDVSDDASGDGMKVTVNNDVSEGKSDGGKKATVNNDVTHDVIGSKNDHKKKTTANSDFNEGEGDAVTSEVSGQLDLHDVMMGDMPGEDDGSGEGEGEGEEKQPGFIEEIKRSGWWWWV